MKYKKILAIGLAAMILSGTAIFNILTVKAYDCKVSDEVKIQNIEMDENTRVVNEDENSITIEKDFKADEIHSEGSIKPSTRMWPGFSIRNIRTNGQRTDRNRVVSSDDIVAGTSYTFKVTSTATTSIENVASIQAAEFNGKIGLKSTKSVSVSKSFTTKCPKTYNGRKVKSCTVTYYPKYQKYKFDEYFLESKKTVGYAEVLCGFTQSIVYHY